jgi:hypothetical protein
MFSTAPLIITSTLLSLHGELPHFPPSNGDHHPLLTHSFPPFQRSVILPISAIASPIRHQPTALTTDTANTPTYRFSCPTSECQSALDDLLTRQSETIACICGDSCADAERWVVEMDVGLVLEAIWEEADGEFEF